MTSRAGEDVPRERRPEEPVVEAAFLRALGQRLAACRRERALTQGRLAECAGLSVTFVSGLERGAHSVSVVRLRRLAIALGVDVRELIPGDLNGPPEGCDQS